MSIRKFIHLKHNPHRVYIFDRHLHHGRTGEIFLLIGLILILTDWRDWPFRFIRDAMLYE